MQENSHIKNKKRTKHNYYEEDENNKTHTTENES